MSKFDFVQFLDYCDRYKITFFFTVPPIYLLIVKSPAVTNQFQHLEYAISGAAPMGKELQEVASAKFKNGQTFISQTWGLSENTGSATLNNFGEVDLSGSVSRLLPNMKLRCVVFSALLSDTELFARMAVVYMSHCSMRQFAWSSPLLFRLKADFVQNRG